MSFLHTIRLSENPIEKMIDPYFREKSSHINTFSIIIENAIPLHTACPFGPWPVSVSSPPATSRRKNQGMCCSSALRLCFCSRLPSASACAQANCSHSPSPGSPPFRSSQRYCNRRHTGQSVVLGFQVPCRACQDTHYSAPVTAVRLAARPPSLG